MSKLNDIDAVLAFPLRLKVIEYDDYLHNWETLNYYWLENAPKSSVPERSCYNCSHLSPVNRWFDDGDCRHPDNENFFEMCLDAANGEVEYLVIAERCPYYQPIYFNCSACHKRIETPMHLITSYAPGLYDSEPYCSEQCHEILVQKYERELAAQEEYEEALAQQDLTESDEPFDYHAADLAFDAARERRYFGRR